MDDDDYYNDEYSRDDNDDLNVEEDSYEYDEYKPETELRPEASAYDRVAKRWEESSDEERFERAMYRVSNTYKLVFDQEKCRDMLSAVARDMPIRYKHLETLILGYYVLTRNIPNEVIINKDRFNSVLSRMKLNKINYIKPEDLLKYGRFVQTYYTNYIK